MVTGEITITYDMRFPSPCGEWVRKVVALVSVFGGSAQFPSPCGEWVRKESVTVTSPQGDGCFRPLAGNGLGKNL